MTEKEARKLEVPIEWNGRANVCVHCGKVPETFYVATGHDHTDYDIRWCPCREPNHNWCAGCSPDNCSGCGTFYEIKKQRDELLAALEQFATWGRMQHKAQSKGGHATFDMLLLKDEIDLAEAAIASVKGQK